MLRLVGIVSILALVLPASALADTAVKRDKGGVSQKVAKRFKLTAAERRALDIASIQVTGQEGFGIVVDVRFKGNLTARLGRGHLRRAAIALVLRPRSRAFQPAVIVTQGGARDQRVRRRTSSRQAGAVRTGKSVKFFVKGSGFSRAGRVQVLALPRAPRAARNARAAQDGVEELTGDEVEEITLEQIQADAAVIKLLVRRTDPDRFECDELEDMLEDLEDALDYLADHRDLLADALEALERARDQATNPMERAELNEAIREVQATRRMVAEAGIVTTELRDEVERILDEECGPPPGVDALRAVAIWVLFGANEVMMQNAYFESPGGSQGPITEIRVLIPDAGATNRQVTAYLCPAQYGMGEIIDIEGESSGLRCHAGSLALGERFNMNVRTSPNPSAGMGGRLWAFQDGTMKGPFPITGP